MPLGEYGNFKYKAIKVISTKHRHEFTRISWISGPIVRRRTVNGRVATPSPLAGRTADLVQVYDPRDDARTSFENGHLIGLTLGGPDLPFNIAPMYSYFNQITYRRLEREIAEDVSLKYMGVEVFYHADLPMIPREFRIEVKSVSSTYTRQIPMLLVEFAPYSLPDGDGWAELANIIDLAMPAVRDPVTPYAFMDALRGRLGLPQPAMTTEFSKKEKIFVRIANWLYSLRFRSSRFLMSDLPVTEDPFQTLAIEGGDNRPEVDHIHPKSFGGSNSFANARLISKYANGRKLASITEEQLRNAMAARLIPASRATPTSWDDVQMLK